MRQAEWQPGQDSNSKRTVSAAAAVHELRRFVRIVFIVFALAMIYVTWQSYEGRKDLRNAQVKGCERGKADRRDAARGWTVAARARRDSYLHDGQRTDLRAALAYEDIVRGMERRASIVCVDVYPAPSLIPLSPGR